MRTVLVGYTDRIRRRGMTVGWLIALGIGAAAALPVLAIAWSLAATDPPDEGFDALFEASGPETRDEALSMWSGIPVHHVGSASRASS